MYLVDERPSSKKVPGQSCSSLRPVARSVLHEEGDRKPYGQVPYSEDSECPWCADCVDESPYQWREDETACACA